MRQDVKYSMANESQTSLMALEVKCAVEIVIDAIHHRKLLGLLFWAHLSLTRNQTFTKFLRNLINFYEI